jgi:hypothetical protein
MRDAVSARFAKRFESFEPRAVLSIWTKWYIDTFLPPMLLADLLLVRRLPVALDSITFIISDDARVDYQRGVILGRKNADSGLRCCQASGPRRGCLLNFTVQPAFRLASVLFQLAMR